MRWGGGSRVMRAEADEDTGVAVVGGGLVGCSLGLALAHRGQRPVLIEATPEGPVAPPSFDERNLALARASLDALAMLGVLEGLDRLPEPITQIHVSRAGDLGSVRLDAAEHGVAAFGGVVMARDLGKALSRAVSANPAISRRSGTAVTAIEPVAQGWRLHLATTNGDRSSLRCRLLVAADGSDSRLRGWLGLDEEVQDYGQHLVVCSIEAAGARRGQAWERFSATGPVALLPRNDGRWGAVCGVATAEAGAVMALDDAAYAEYLQSRFGWRAGRLSRPGRRVAYPLRLRVARRVHAERAVLVGNAAQTLHPVGAQGFNLGLRDALGLAEAVAGAEDPGVPQRLAAYLRSREEDRRRTLAFSDGLARLTASENVAARALRSLGLLALGVSRRARAPLVHAAMGLTGMPETWRGEAS